MIRPLEVFFNWIQINLVIFIKITKNTILRLKVELFLEKCISDKIFLTVCLLWFRCTAKTSLLRASIQLYCWV